MIQLITGRLHSANDSRGGVNPTQEEEFRRRPSNLIPLLVTGGGNVTHLTSGSRAALFE